MSIEPRLHPVFPDPEFFSCEVHPERDAVRVRMFGSLDMSTAPECKAQLDELRGFDRMIVDLGALDFMDSSGLRLLLTLDADARQDGFAIEIVPGPPVVQRIFELTGTLDRLPFIRR